MFYKSHPHIFLVIETLKSIQQDTYILMRSKSTKKNEKQEFLRKKMSCLTRGEITQMEFVKSVSFKFLPKTKK